MHKRFSPFFRLAFSGVLAILFLLWTTPALAELPIPSIQIGVGQATSPKDVGVALQILALLTVLAVAPALLILMTSFTRIVVVFHFLRQALATQSAPPNQVLIGLALFMTFFIMKPVWQQAYLAMPGLRHAGGTDEILRNIIAERVLGMPGEPRMDKEKPFKDIPSGTTR